MANQLYGKVYFNNKLKIILNIFFYWLLLILLGFYFANNTLYLDKVGGVSLSILVFVFGAFALKSLFILIRKNKDCIFIHRSLFFLLLLILYISIRIVTDKSDISYLRTFLFSTTLGSLLFYLLGSFIAFVNSELNLWCKRNKKLANYNYYLGFFYILCNFLLNSFVFIKLLPRRRPVFFLIDAFGFYQRPGNFIIINTFLMAYCYFSIQSNNRKNYILDIIYFCYYIITILLVQFIGSNNGFLGVFGIMFFSIIYKFYLLNKYKNEQKSFVKPNKSNSINKYILSFFKNLGLNSLYLIIVLIILFVSFRNYLPPIRILHYNLNEEYNPMDERLKSFKDNFIPQFSVNPVVGNMEADTIVSGKGTLMHSFILSMMTHIGIIGVTLFFLYFIYALFEFYRDLYYINDYRNICHKLFILLLTIFVFFMANISSSLSWNPIWFVFGFSFSSIFYRRKILNDNSIKSDCVKLELKESKTG